MHIMAHSQVLTLTKNKSEGEGPDMDLALSFRPLMNINKPEALILMYVRSIF